MILTLQDQQVLNADDDDIHSGIDILENVDVAQSFKQKVMNRRKQQLSHYQNSKYLPDEEDEVDDGWNSEHKSLLTKYDDVEQ